MNRRNCRKGLARILPVLDCDTISLKDVQHTRINGLIRKPCPGILDHLAESYALVSDHRFRTPGVDGRPADGTACAAQP